MLALTITGTDTVFFGFLGVDLGVRSFGIHLFSMCVIDNLPCGY